MTPVHIATEVAKWYGVSLDDLRSHGFRNKLSLARGEVAWICYHKWGFSTPMIGKCLGGRDHSSALYLRNKFQREIDAGRATDRSGDLPFAPPVMFEPEYVIERVCEWHRVTVADIRRCTQFKRFIRARHEAAFLCSILTRAKSVEIGKLIGYKGQAASGIVMAVASYSGPDNSEHIRNNSCPWEPPKPKLPSDTKYGRLLARLSKDPARLAAYRQRKLAGVRVWQARKAAEASAHV